MMRSQANAKRRIYTRNGTQLVCLGGRLYRPTKAGTQVDPSKEVGVEHLEASGGKQRVRVVQGKEVEERWIEAAAPS